MIATGRKGRSRTESAASSDTSNSAAKFDGITVPDSVSIRVLPDELERPFLVEVLLAFHRAPLWRDGLPAPLGRRTLNSTATR